MYEIRERTVRKGRKSRFNGNVGAFMDNMCFVLEALISIIAVANSSYPVGAVDLL